MTKKEEVEKPTEVKKTKKSRSPFKYEPYELKVRYPGDDPEKPLTEEEIKNISERTCNCPHKCTIHLGWNPKVLWKIAGYTGALFAAGYIGKTKIKKWEEK